jgi:tRNA-dihydrouridine synthase B
MDFLKSGKRTLDPTLAQQYELIKIHFEEMVENYGERSAVLIGRKHMGWYSKGLKDSTNFRLLVNQVQDAAAVRELVTRFFEEQLARS